MNFNSSTPKTSYPNKKLTKSIQNYNSQELYSRSYSPIKSHEGIPTALIPILETPELRLTPILTPPNLNHASYLDDSITPCSSNEFESVSSGCSSEYVNGSPILKSGIVNNVRKRKHKLRKKKLFTIDEADTESDFQVMSDLTLQEIEEICRFSETMYNDTSRKISCCISGCNDDQIEQDSDLFGQKEIDEYKFSYPTSTITKLEDPNKVDEVLQSAMLIEKCDKILLDKPKLTHQSLVTFSQFNQNSDFVCHKTDSTFQNYNFGYCTVVDLMKTADIYNSLKQYFEIIRNDFVREMTKCESLSILKILSIIKQVHPYTTIIFQKYLRALPQFEKKLMLKQFFGFFRSNPNLLCNRFLKLGHLYYQKAVDRGIKRKSKSVLKTNAKKLCASNATQTKTMIQNLLEGITELDFCTQYVTQHPCQKAITAPNVCDATKEFNTYNNIVTETLNSVSSEYDKINETEFDCELNSKLELPLICVDKRDMDFVSAGNNNFAVFTTGHGKVIPVKKETMEHGKKIFETLPELESHKNIKKTLGAEKKCTNSFNDLLGNMAENRFINGHEKVIPVCKESIKQGKKILQDLTPLKLPENDLTVGFENLDESFMRENDKSFLSTEKSMKFQMKIDTSCLSGFSTAMGKNICLKKESMEKVKHLFADVCDDNDLPTFSTGQGNTISVRKETLECGRKMLNDLPEIGSLSNIKSLIGAESKNKNTHHGNMFLKNTENIELDNECEDFLNSTDISATFTTGSGKPIPVLNEFLERGQKIFQESSEFDSEGNFIGFSTLFNHKLTNVNENLLENKKNDQKCVINEPNVLNQTRINHMQGFSTAAGRNISVKNEFVSKTKCLFDDITNEMNSFDALFMNGHRNIINVKKENVEHSKKIFDELPEIDSSSNYNLMLPDAEGSERKNDITAVSTEGKNNEDVDSGLAINISHLRENVSAHFSDSARKVEAHVRLQSGNSMLNCSETLLHTGNTSKNIDSLVMDEVSNMDIEQFFNTNFSILCDDTTINDQSFNEPINENSTPSIKKQSSEMTSTSSDELEKKNEKRAPSPIIETRKNFQKSKLRKRKSQNSICPRTPLKITYYSNREIDCSQLNEVRSSEDTLEELKRNFNQKSNKRKTSSVESVPVKKCIKFDQVEMKDSSITKLQKFVDTKPASVCKPIVGWYTALRQRSGQVISLLDAVENSRPVSFTDRKLINFGVKSSIIKVNSQNAANFKFSSEFLPPFCSFELIYGDGCRIIPNENGEVDINSITLAFLAAPGVDPKLVPEKWIINHYRWIIWKLASVEKSFPEKYGGRYLNIDNVMFQLKYRYDREIDNCERSALKRIIEFDDTPSKPMILCVASIITVSQEPKYEYDVELTDGWYSVFCLIDQEMCKLIATKKVVVGSKLLITNSELIGLSEGCDPLQISNEVRLKIFTNSTRRVRWHARLGFYFQTSGPIVRNLKFVLPNGGISFPITVLISRIYPMMYMEKKYNGYSEIYNEKMELRRATKEEQEKQIWYEGIVSQITKEVQAENNIDADSTEYFSEEAQKEMQLKYDRIHAIIRERIEQKVSKNFREKRKVIRLLKIRIANDSDESPPISAMVTIWNPSDDIFSAIREGRMCTFSHLNAVNSRNNELRLSSTRWTKYELHNVVPKCNPYFRKCVGFWELKHNFMPSFSEVDIVGVVVDCADNDFVDELCNHSTIYLADLQMNFVAVKFRSTVKDSGMDDIIKRKEIVAGMNLHWSQGSLSWRTPVLMVDEYSMFMLKSKHRHLQDGLEKLDNFFKNESLDTFILKCQNKLKSIMDSALPNATSTPLRTSFRTRSSVISNDSFTTNDTSVSKMKMGELENSKSFVNADRIFNKSSNSSKNQSRIDKLRMYDEPPPLSPIQISTKLKRSSSLK